MLLNATNRPSPVFTRRSVLLWTLGTALARPLASTNGQGPPPPANQPPTNQPPKDQPPKDQPLRLIDESSSVESRQALASVRYLTAIALRHLPQKYDGDKHWGDTKKIWSGVKIRFDDGKLKTHRRFREVEHGRWIQYEVLLPPAGLTLDESVWIRSVSPIRTTAPLTAGSGLNPGFRIDATAITPATYRVRVQRWNRGVRLVSVTVQGVLKIRLDATLDVRLGPDYREIPPAMQIDPTVSTAELSLERFQVDRVSRIGGDAAELWGEMIQRLFVERLIEKQNDRLVEKLNRGIEKNRDDLRLSTLDWIRKGFAKGQPER